MGSVIALASLSIGCAAGSIRQAQDPAPCSIVAADGTAGSPQCTDRSDAAYGFSALANAPEIRAAEARGSAAEEEIAKAMAARLPNAGFVASAGGATERFGDLSGSRSGGIYSYALGVDVPLYQGGRAVAAIDAARADFKAANQATRDRRVATAYELALALARIDQQREAIAVLDRQERSLRRLAGEVRAELRGGGTSRVDVDDVERQLARIAVVREEAQLAVSEAEFTTRRLGISPDTRLPDASALQLPDSEQELVALAMRDNPRVNERAARVEGAEARVAQAKGELLPTVSANVRMGGERLQDTDDSQLGIAELRFSMPIYSGGLRPATISQRKDERLSAQLERDAAVDGVVAAVGSAIDRRAKARRMYVLAEVEKSSAAVMLEGLREERKVGERSTFDEIRAIENLANADLNLLSARYQLQAAEFTLAAETGLIDRLIDVAGSPAGTAG